MADLPFGAGLPRAHRSESPAPRALEHRTAARAPGMHRHGGASLESAELLIEPANRVHAEDDDERELLRRISQADRDAFRQLYLAYHGRLVRFLSRVTRHSGDVEEVINDALLIVWQRAADFRGASRVSTWIFGIAYRCALRAIRKSAAWSRAVALASPGGEAVVEDAARGTEERQLLQLGLSFLPPEQRLALVLAYCMNYSCEEIAAIAACPVNTVKSRMFHARRKLRALIGVAALPRPSEARAEGRAGPDGLAHQ